MKRNTIIFSVLVVILIIIFSTKVFSQKFTKFTMPYDFRQTNWGMSKEEVKLTEKRKPNYEDDVILLYEVKIDKYDCACIYHFLENKLFQSKYAFNEKHLNKNAYIEDYENLKELLTKKYGKPKWEDIIWKDDFYKDIKGNWGLAVARGDLEYTIIWENSITTIQIQLEGNNYEISLIIVYYSNELYDWAKEILDKKSIKDL